MNVLRGHNFIYIYIYIKGGLCVKNDSEILINLESKFVRNINGDGSPVMADNSKFLFSTENAHAGLSIFDLYI